MVLLDVLHLLTLVTLQQPAIVQTSACVRGSHPPTPPLFTTGLFVRRVIQIEKPVQGKFTVGGLEVDDLREVLRIIEQIASSTTSLEIEVQFGKAYDKRLNKLVEQLERAAKSHHRFSVRTLASESSHVRGITIGLDPD